MNKNFDDSGRKWLSNLSDVITGKALEFEGNWFQEKCRGECGYCREFGSCYNCPLYIQRICVSATMQSDIKFYQLGRAYGEKNQLEMIRLTSEIFLAVTNPENKKLFKEEEKKEEKVLIFRVGDLIQIGDTRFHIVKASDLSGQVISFLLAEGNSNRWSSSILLPENNVYKIQDIRKMAGSYEDKEIKLIKEQDWKRY